jgi:hypothetical protein
MQTTSRAAQWLAPAFRDAEPLRTRQMFDHSKADADSIRSIAETSPGLRYALPGSH